MKHRRLIALRVRHGFYEDEQCPDVEIRPTAATARLLQANRWRWVPVSDGLQLSSLVDASGKPELGFPEGSRLTFRLRLLTPEFSVFTSLPAAFGEGVPVYSLAVGAVPPVPGTPAVLVPAVRQASVVEVFSFPPGVVEARFALGGSPKPGVTGAAFVVEGLGADAKAVLDERRRQVTVTAKASAAGVREMRLRYPVVPAREPGVFAEVDIEAPDLAGGSIGEREYQIRFEPLQARWQYFFITDLPPAQDTFLIEATGPVAFGRVPADPAEPMARALLGRYPETSGFRVSSFVSNNPLPCREKPVIGLKLKRGDGGWAEALPSPEIRNLCRIGDQPGFFHVVTRIAKP